MPYYVSRSCKAGYRCRTVDLGETRDVSPDSPDSPLWRSEPLREGCQTFRPSDHQKPIHNSILATSIAGDEFAYPTNASLGIQQGGGE
jgi:hypothetical protein